MTADHAGIIQICVVSSLCSSRFSSELAGIEQELASLFQLQVQSNTIDTGNSAKNL